MPIQVGQQFKICSSMSMTGATTVTSSATSIERRNGFSIQANVTGTPVGTFDIQGSVDYNPGLPQSEGILNNGNWVSISPLSATPAVTGSATSILFDMQGVTFPWIRLSYTNSTSSGQFDAWIFSKSYG
jgi:hypothetical protein